MPNFIDLGDGRFRVRVRVKDQVTGKWSFKSQNVTGGKREAERVGREMETAKDKGMLRAGRSPTVADFAELWLKGIKHTVAYETFRGYSVNVRRHIAPFLGELRLKDLTTAHVRAFLGHLHGQGLSPRTGQSARAVLRMIIERAVDDGFSPRNVVSKARPPKIERRDMLTLDEPQARLLLEQAGATRLIAPVVLGLMSGLRRGEICGLRWRDVDLERGELSVLQTIQRQTGKGLVVQPPKSNGSLRSVSLPPSAVAHLRKWRGRQREDRLAAGPAWRGGDYVCATLDGGPLEPTELSKSFRRLADSLDLPPVRFHDLRHTYAHVARRAGVDIKLIQAALGHATAAFTLDVYGHVGAGELKEAAAKIDRAIWG
ncbi:MAG: site-specific integrase [Bacillota bacterium]|nr:site-specific integrase [Bacillota bacterium]